MVLTDTQQQALQLGQNIFVEAGAGSGKTTILVHRYLALLEQHSQCGSANIVVITFTRKAAEELKARLEQKTSLSLQQAPITTIHGFCAMTLKEFPFECDLFPHFGIWEPSDQLFWKQKIEEEFLQNPPEILHFVIDHALTSMSLLEFKKNIWHPSHPASHYLIQQYQAKKQENGVLDYDDLIERTILLFLEYPHILRLLQKRYAFIMVDEFQDTDEKQWQLIQLLCDEYDYLRANKLFLVGDVKQSIYGFRGVNSRQFLRVMSEFEVHPFSKVIRLGDNFRSQSLLIDWINQHFKPLFENGNPSIQYTELKSYRKETDGSLFVKEESIDYLIEFIKDQANRGIAFSEMAILGRRKKLFPDIQKALMAAHIPVIMIDKLSEKEETWDLFALFCILLHPEDTLHWFRLSKRWPLINPEMGQAFQCSLPFSIEKWVLTAQYSGFANTLLTLGNFLSFSTDILSPFIEILSKIETTTPKHELKERLKQLILSHSGVLLGTEGIHLLSIHASKGLEFKSVVLIEAGNPFYCPNKDLLPEVLEEEKRLLYVACTRAKDHLLIMGNVSEKKSYLHFLNLGNL